MVVRASQILSTCRTCIAEYTCRAEFSYVTSSKLYQNQNVCSYIFRKFSTTRRHDSTSTVEEPTYEPAATARETMLGYEGKVQSQRAAFMDSMRISVQAGKGGEGYVKKGGIGGRGGNVVIKGAKNIRFSLKDVIQKCPHKRFVADKGYNAKLFTLFADPGPDTVITVPVGVVAIKENGEKLGEVNQPEEEVVIAKGGAGGSPENGYAAKMGEKHMVTLDLKIIADVGFVGFPNAGKSTLLKALSRSKPVIASYPFTTIRPNVGVIKYEDHRKISLADLPGLIEGAHLNQGMGFSFLKHVERTKVLLFIVDLHGFQLSPQYPRRTALETIVLLNRELELYRNDLVNKPAVLALNKTDLPGSFSHFEEVETVLKDEALLRSRMQSLPSEFHPEKIVKFDAIIPVSAAKDPGSVKKLSRVIRKVIDVNDDLEREQLEQETQTQVKDKSRKVSRSR